MKYYKDQFVQDIRGEFYNSVAALNCHTYSFTTYDCCNFAAGDNADWNFVFFIGDTLTNLATIKE